MTSVLPMFPLGSVLFPGTFLPLHVFEPRYRALTRACLDADRRFGVVLIERGFEVGGGDSRFDVGTIADIVEAVELGDGRWALGCIGTERIRVERWLGEDPFPRAEVAPLVDRGHVQGETRERAERAVRRCLALRSELDEPAAPATVVLHDDPAIAAWQLAAIAPLGPLDHVRLLAMDDAEERTATLAALAEEEADVLAFRLASGA